MPHILLLTECCICATLQVIQKRIMQNGVKFITKICIIVAKFRFDKKSKKYNATELSYMGYARSSLQKHAKSGISSAE